MASGTITFPASGYLQGKVEWSSVSNGSSANTSTATATLYARRTNNATTTGQSWWGYVGIGGENVFINFATSVSVGPSWVQMATITRNVSHNNDGTKQITVEGIVRGPTGTSLANNTSEGYENVWLDTIPRYTSISSFTVSKRNETSLTFNWGTTDIIDYVWYSTNNGSNWTGVDVTDGTSGSFVVSGLSANISYNCKLRVRRKDSQLTTDSGTVSQTTYKVPSHSLKSKTETTIVMNWSCDSEVDYLWYSTNNGSSWTGVDVTDGTSGSYTISGLSANTAYNIKTRCRRKATQTTYDTGALSVTTYDYPYCTSSPNFTIGNSVKLEFYNPLGRNITVTMIGNGNNIIGSGSTTGTSISGFNDATSISNQYSSIPNAKSYTYQVKVVYGSSTKTRNNGNTYTVNSSNCTPTAGALTYMDTNSTVVNITQNNQRIVRNQSTLQFSCAAATAKHSASISKYEVTFNNVTMSRTTAGALNYGTINLSYGATATLVVTDSRGFTAQTTCSVTIDNWVAPYAVTTLNRKNNYEAETYLKVDGTISSVNNKNTMSIRYRYKNTSASAYSAWATLSDNTQITLTLDNTLSWDFQIQVIDKFVTTTYNFVLAIGMPIIFIDSTTQNIGINMFPSSNGSKVQISGGLTVDGQKYIGYEVVDEW